MTKIAKNLTELIGNTPLLELSSFKEDGAEATILAKLEYFNPAGSVKDRIGYGMLKDAEDKGLINKETTIIEPTSGNTGIGLAFAAAALGYRLIIILPESFSMERRKLLKQLGAELVLTEASEGMAGAIRRRASCPPKFRTPISPSSSRIRPIRTFTGRRLRKKSGTIPRGRWIFLSLVWARVERLQESAKC